MSFYDEWLLNFIKYFLYRHQDSHIILLLYSINVGNYTKFSNEKPHITEVSSNDCDVLSFRCLFANSSLRFFCFFSIVMMSEIAL